MMYDILKSDIKSLESEIVLLRQALHDKGEIILELREHNEKLVEYAVELQRKLIPFKIKGKVPMDND
tara:strand:- start:9 stop:209 length:201 start_codon:yes stop_codon:yes gene_type:complete